MAKTPEETIKEIQVNLAKVQQRVAQEGVTDASGKVLIAPTTPTPTISPPQTNAYGNVVGSGATGGTPTSIVPSGNTLGGGENPSLPISNVNTGNEELSTLMKTIQDKLLAQGDIVTSGQTDLEEFIKGQATSLQQAQEKAATGIEAAYTRAKTDISETGATKLTSQREQQRGYAVNQGVIKQIEQDTEKNLKDLDLRKQEALASGAMDVADKISGLQLQAMSYAQTAKQNAFQNMLSMGNFGLQMFQAKQSQTQQNIQNKRDVLNFLTTNNLIGGMSDADKRQQEVDLGLPTGSLDKVKPGEQYQQVGDSLIRIYKDASGNTQFQTVFTGTGTQSSDIKNYQYYVSQEKASGRTPLSFDQWSLRSKDDQLDAIDLMVEKQGIQGLYPNINVEEIGITYGDTRTSIKTKLNNYLTTQSQPVIPTTTPKTGNLMDVLTPSKSTPAPKTIPTTTTPKTTTGTGGTTYQPQVNKSEAQKIDDENAKRAKLGLLPLAGGTKTTQTIPFPLTIDASGNITNLKEMPVSQLLDLYSSFG